jgi:hypothetical protein
MAKEMIVEIDVETGEVIEREMTADELAQSAIDKAKAQSEAKIEATKAAEKAALLEKLGITEDEARLLLG